MLIRIALDDDYKVTHCGYGSNDYYSHTNDDGVLIPDTSDRGDAVLYYYPSGTGLTDWIWKSKEGSFTGITTSTVLIGKTFDPKSITFS